MLKKSSKFEFDNCTFENSSNIFSIHESEVILKDCSFINNRNLFQSGLPSKNTTKYTIENCTFKNNQSIFITGSVDAKKCLFEENETLLISPHSHNPQNAPVLVFSLIFAECTFNNNNNLFQTDNANIVISKCGFDKNYSDLGGIIFNKKRCTISNSIFTNNSAKYGGVVYNSMNGECHISDSSFENNHANQAGAIYNESRYKTGFDGMMGNKVSGGKLFLNENNNFSGNMHFNNGEKEENSLIDVPNCRKF